MRNDRVDNSELNRTYEVWRIANTAAKKAQEKNRKLGIPNVYSFNGQLYYENKNGEIIKGSPFEQ